MPAQVLIRNAVDVSILLKSQTSCVHIRTYQVNILLLAQVLNELLVVRLVAVVRENAKLSLLTLDGPARMYTAMKKYARGSQKQKAQQQELGCRQVWNIIPRHFSQAPG